MKRVLKQNLPEKICLTCNRHLVGGKNGNAIGRQSNIVVKNVNRHENSFGMVTK